MRTISLTTLILIVLILLTGCLGSNKDKNTTSNFAPDGDALKRIITENSAPLVQDKISIPLIIDKEEKCDGNDDDKDGLTDEGCFRCNSLRGDYDGDGKVTELDCGVAILFANNATTFSGDTSCIDLDKDGMIGMGDTIACLDILNSGGGQ